MRREYQRVHTAAPGALLPCNTGLLRAECRCATKRLRSVKDAGTAVRAGGEHQEMCRVEPAKRGRAPEPVALAANTTSWAEVMLADRAHPPSGDRE